MTHLTPPQILVSNHLRNLILTHATLLNPSAHGTLQLVTYPNNNGGWDVRLIAITPEPYECRVLAHVDSDLGERVAMQDMLYLLQKRTEETLGKLNVNSVVSLGDEGRRRGGSYDMRAEWTDSGHERYERRNAYVPAYRRYSHPGPSPDEE